MKLQLGPEKVSPGLHVPTRVVVVPPRSGNAALLKSQDFVQKREKLFRAAQAHTKKYNIIQNKCKQRTSYIKKAKSSINTGRNILKKRGSSLDRFPTLPEGFRGLIQKIRSKLCLNKMCRVSGILYFLDQSQKHSSELLLEICRVNAALTETSGSACRETSLLDEISAELEVKSYSNISQVEFKFSGWRRTVPVQSGWNITWKDLLSWIYYLIKTKIDELWVDVNNGAVFSSRSNTKTTERVEFPEVEARKRLVQVSENIVVWLTNCITYVASVTLLCDIMLVMNVTSTSTFTPNSNSSQLFHVHWLPPLLL